MRRTTLQRAPPAKRYAPASHDSRGSAGPCFPERQRHLNQQHPGGHALGPLRGRLPVHHRRQRRHRSPQVRRLQRRAQRPARLAGRLGRADSDPFGRHRATRTALPPNHGIESGAAQHGSWTTTPTGSGRSTRFRSRTSAASSGTPGLLDAPNDLVRGPISRTLCAAFNRSTLLTNTSQRDPSGANFYNDAVTNQYATLIHAQMADGSAYAFAFDDVGNHESLVHDVGPPAGVHEPRPLQPAGPPAPAVGHQLPRPVHHPRGAAPTQPDGSRPQGREQYGALHVRPPAGTTAGLRARGGT